ncbi:STAS domain-containing protein [Aerosakkonema sp. BLCC-F183]|uniref:STAS domain-containing protein n=1 Tax=Aerosakkonema sp. BLCC-F183 TaxID=3342834 RepID=UPI0035BA8DBE
MDINIKTLPDEVTVVEMVGDIDASTAPKAQAEILPLAVAGSKILLDMTKVPYTSSAGLRMLLSLYRQIDANKGKLVLVGISEQIQDTMSVTGFLEYFTRCDTVDSGLEILKG